MKNGILEKSYIPFQCLIINTLNKFNVEGVSTAQYQILDALARHGEKTTKELAELRGVSQSGTSKLTKKLLDRNYIEQTRSVIDRRSYNIAITPAGKEFLKRSENFRNEVLLVIEAALSQNEIEVFAGLCRKIVASESFAHENEKE